MDRINWSNVSWHPAGPACLHLTERGKITGFTPIALIPPDLLSFRVLLEARFACRIGRRSIIHASPVIGNIELADRQTSGEMFRCHRFD
jgi:hypothetical protein